MEIIRLMDDPKILGQNSLMSDNYAFERFSREFRTITNRRLWELLQSNSFGTVIIIGVGGIGSWLALYMSRLRYINLVVLIDDDLVEASNLNRTPFDYPDIGEFKVEAMSRKIIANNPQQKICIFPNRVDSVDWSIMPKITEPGRAFVFDCRDNDYQDHEHLEGCIREFTRGSDPAFTRVAYNGASITVDMKPENKHIYGASGYETQPSSVFPSSLCGF